MARRSDGTTIGRTPAGMRSKSNILPSCSPSGPATRADLLAGVASLLVHESKGLLLGESVDPEVLEDIRGIVAADPAVDKAGYPLTMHLAPEEVLLKDLDEGPNPIVRARRNRIPGFGRF